MKKLIALTLACLPFVLIAQNLTSTTNITITKIWGQSPSGYTYPIAINVPSGPAPADGFPVCILLHGNGGNGAQTVNQFSSILQCHALVAPSGYMNSWNLCAEDSDGPDIEMVHDLIDSLQNYSNINPNQIRVLGFSNGAGLANSVYIENTNPGVDIVCPIVSHLNEPQYHNGNFYKIAANTDSSQAYCGYNQVANPLTTRKYLSISNDNDPVIPFQGGYSNVGVSFLSAVDAAFIIAEHKGFTGSKITGFGTPIGNPLVFEYSYLSGDVVLIRGAERHGMNVTQENYIKTFFGDCSTVTSLQEVRRDELKVYPRSFSTQITVEVEEGGNQLYQVFSVLGDLVKVGRLNDAINRIDLASLPANVYFLNISNRTIKLVKVD